MTMTKSSFSRIYNLKLFYRTDCILMMFYNHFDDISAHAWQAIANPPPVESMYV